MTQRVENYDKLIICDFDETLVFVENYDFKNARVNLPLVDKLNRLVDRGYIVDIYTARGHLSCTSRQEADKKYRVEIESLLKNIGLKYRKLSFDKPFGCIYIDDRAMTPREFIERFQ